MPVFRWGHSWDAFDNLGREVDRLLQSVNLTFHRIRVGRQYPPINLYELDDEFLLTAELPGTRSDELELTTAGGILTIKGRRDDAHGVPEERFRRHERFRGNWQRSVSLPDRVRDELLSAEFKNGILKIRLPKAEELKSRHIPVVEGSD